VKKRKEREARRDAHPSISSRSSRKKERGAKKEKKGGKGGEEGKVEVPVCQTEGERGKRILPRTIAFSRRSPFFWHQSLEKKERWRGAPGAFEKKKGRGGGRPATLRNHSEKRGTGLLGLTFFARGREGGEEI